MLPLGIHHVSLNVSDTAQSVPFYTDVLGGTLRTDRPDFRFGGAWIDLGPQQVHLIEGDVPPSMGQHFALHVSDLDAAVAELRSRGIAIDEPRAVGSGRQTFLEDPSGNVIELHEVAPVTAA